MDNAKIDTARAVLPVRLDLRLMKTPQPPSSPDICPSDFFLFGWLKGKPQPLINEIFASLSVDTIEDVFRNWIHRLE
jgi:hypothetical protein